MAKLLARRLTATFTSDSPVVPLFIICILSGLILFVAGARGLSEGQDLPASPELSWSP